MDQDHLLQRLSVLISFSRSLSVCVWEYLYIFLKRKAKTVAQKQKSFLSEVKWGFHWPASIPAARGYSTAGVPLCDLNHAFYFESWRNRFHSYGSVVAWTKKFFFKKSIDAKWKEQIGKARLWACFFCQQKTMNKTQKKPHLMKHSRWNVNNEVLQIYLHRYLNSQQTDSTFPKYEFSQTRRENVHLQFWRTGPWIRPKYNLSRFRGYYANHIFDMLSHTELSRAFEKRIIPTENRNIHMTFCNTYA